MCGIYAVVNDDNAAQTVLEGLKRLEYRGYDSWGIAVNGVSDATGPKILLEKHTGKIGEAKTSLPKSTVGFGHTRWATHGGVTEANAHPHTDCSGKIAVIHNGIVENYQELRGSLKKTHVFKSQTDTEVMAHVIEELLVKYSFREAVRRAFKKATGLNALIVFDPQNKEFVAVKNGSPLVVGVGKSRNYIASDIASLLSHTNRVIFLGDNEMAVVHKDGVELFDLNGKKKRAKIETLKMTLEDAVRGKYPHFMLKEIHEQPRVITNIVENLDRQIADLARAVQKSGDVVFAGCGTASYAALAGKYLFSVLANTRADAVQANEFGYIESMLDKNTLPIFISQSGETIDVVEPVRHLKEHGIRVAGLVNVLGSTLYRLADYRVMLGAGPEICVASTKAFIAMLSVLILLAAEVGKKREYGKKILREAVRACAPLLKPEFTKNTILPLVKTLRGTEHMFVIGRGIAYAATMEAALKIKEVSYVHVEGFAGGELKHGMIALIDPKQHTPCIVLAPDDETHAEMISNAMEVKSRGGYIIGVSPKNNEVFDYYIPVPGAKEASIIPLVVAIQLLAYHLAVAKGYDPDKPRNLAKSVTVK